MNRSWFYNVPIAFYVLVFLPLLYMTRAETWSFFFTDVLYIPAIYEDVFIDGFSFKGWALTPAPYFFPDMLLYFFARIAMGHFVPAVFFSGFLQYNFLFILTVLLFRRVTEKKISESISFVLLSFVIIDTFIFIFQPFYILYLLSIHTGALLATLGSFYLVLGSMRKDAWLLAIVVFLSVLSDRIFIILFVLPYVITEMRMHGKFRFTSRMMQWTVFSAIAGLLALSIFKSFFHISSPAKIPIETSLHIFKENFGEFIREPGGLIVFLLILVLLFVLIFQVIKLNGSKKNDRNKIKLYWWLNQVPVIFVLAILAPILSGVYMDKYSIRYMIGAIVFIFLTLPFLISESVFFKKYLSHMLFVAFLASFVVIYNKTGFEFKFSQLIHRYPADIKCLDALGEKYKLEYGLADYWNAKYITLFSKKKLRVNQLDYARLSPIHVLNNKEWYRRQKGSNEVPKYQFIVTDHFQSKDIIHSFGPPDFVETCKGDVYIYKKPLHISLPENY